MPFSFEGASVVIFEFWLPSESETKISLKVFVGFEMRNLTTKNLKGHKKNNSIQTNYSKGPNKRGVLNKHVGVLAF